MGERWTAESVPPLLLAVISQAAGKGHKPGGKVAANLAEVLNVYDALVGVRVGEPCEHPTDELEVWPDGTGTYCHYCGGRVDWSVDKETSDGEGAKEAR